jgi:sucrose phosphorylase
VKTAGTSCFLTPETFTFIDDLTAEARGLGLRVLAEVHAPHRHGEQVATHVDHVYDFALAPLVLHTVFTGDANPLRRWLTTRPANTVTVLDTHDGLGMVDAAGLLTSSQIEAVIERIGSNTNGTSVASRVPSGVYQVSCTAYDALGRDDRTYLLARLLQLFTPGVPQVYYLGLLAGRNAPFTSDAREINRRRYTAQEVDRALRQPVVEALLELVRLRNGHPAFGGEFTLPDAADGELILAWRTGDASAELRVDLPDSSWQVIFSASGKTWISDSDLVVREGVPEV